ncbi:MAG: D-alanyl-D-alanine carboxypeptidase [Lachnospiraceae bacterium]|nr:D-alanyl-D-alanine carboxypeptidase [Lachnospiraceae bacterium]
MNLCLSDLSSRAKAGHSFLEVRAFYFSKLMAFLLAFCLLLVPSLKGIASQSILRELKPLQTFTLETPYIYADSACLIDAHTGTVLYAKNAEEKLYPASTTKVMTALLVLENCDNLQDLVTFSNAAVNGISADSSRIGARVGEQLTVLECMYGLLLRSGNDVAVALAEYVAGSESAFVKMMNDKAVELGCTNTHFMNSHGLTHPDHYTTAYDLALIMKAAVQKELFCIVGSTYSYQVKSTNLRPDGLDPWYMSNRMINSYAAEYYSAVVCGKTGFTDEAGETLVTYARKGDLELICTILKSMDTRYSDTATLYDYGFAGYKTYDMDTAASPFITGALGFYSSLNGQISPETLTITPAGSSYIILPKEASLSQVTQAIRYPKDKPASSREVAELVFSYEGYEVGKTVLNLDAPSMHETEPETAAITDDLEFSFSNGKDSSLIREAPTLPAPQATEGTRISPLESLTRFLSLIPGYPYSLAAVVGIILLIFLLLFLFHPTFRRRREAQKRRKDYQKNAPKYYD